MALSRLCAWPQVRHRESRDPLRLQVQKSRPLYEIVASEFAHAQGLQVNAGHGLDYENTTVIAQIPEIKELNIGHSIVSRAVFVGIHRATRQMIEIMQNARGSNGH